MSACYWPLNLHGLAWVALVPWLIVLPRLSVQAAGLAGVLLGLVFYRIGLAWMFGIHSLLAGMTIAVLAVWMALGFYSARLAVERFSATAMIWAVPLAFMGQEILRCEGLPRLRFVFLALGYSQPHHPALAQLASLGGVYFITFLIVLVNAVLALAVAQRTRAAVVQAGLVLAGVAALAFVAQPANTSQVSPVAAACVQAEEATPRTLQDLTRQALEHPLHPKFVVLPEHTIPDYASARNPVVRGLAELAREYGAVICVGAHTAAPQDAVCDYNNVAMLIGPVGSILGEQAKFVPLPFFSEGCRATELFVSHKPLGEVGTFVCYDGLFTDIPRRSIDRGAQLLLVPNMDAARWPDQERWQHADMAPLRSIELGRCAVRANSAGISQIVDQTGRVLARRTRAEGAGVLVANVSLSTQRTVFVRGGYLFAQIVGIAYLLVVLAVIGRDLLQSVRRRRSSGLKDEPSPAPADGQ